jgi:hypothetical protein
MVLSAMPERSSVLSSLLKHSSRAGKTESQHRINLSAIRIINAGKDAHD